MAPITSELVRRCESYGMDATTTMVCQALGQAVDAGVIELSELLDLVRSCSTADELGDALTMLAAKVNGMSEGRLAIDTDWPPVGWPPAPAGRFRIVGITEEGDTWTR